MASPSPALSALYRLSAAGLLTALVGTPTFGATAWQSPDSIRAAVRQVVATATDSHAASDATVAVDARLRLPACSEPLAAVLAAPIQRGRGTVTVSCRAGQAWRLFVPVQVVERVAAVVVRSGVQAGQPLGALDLEVRTLVSATLPYDYYADPTAAVGLIARRSLPAGSVLAAGALNRPELIARGARVTLISGRGSIMVKSEGIALEPAHANQRLRVRSAAGRIVEGIVEPSGEVRVGL
jgi:flagella basal body P-ring formation protein FlgA